MEEVISKEDLLFRQSLPLNLKIALSRQRIRAYVKEYGTDGVYVGFSGGIDSTVLLSLVRMDFGDSIPALYCDTWLEDPRVRAFVGGFSNVEKRKPLLSMEEIIKKDGWAFPSKEVAQLIYYARMDKRWALNKLEGLDKDGKYSPFRKRYCKWTKLVDAPFVISPNCCNSMKEDVAAAYEKETGRHPFIGLLAEESARRSNAYRRSGCNSFDTKIVYDENTGQEHVVRVDRPRSIPIAFWKKQDIFQFVYEYKLQIAAPYGAVKKENTLFDALGIPEPEGYGCRYCTSGCGRTGCVFCPIGCHLDNFAKFRELNIYNKKLYDYCMDGLGERAVLRWINEHIVHDSSFKI